MKFNWELGACLYWLFWAISFAIWETYAGFHNDKVPMLTQVVVKYVPATVTMLLLSWGMWHFGSRYLNPAYMKWIKGN